MGNVSAGELEDSFASEGMLEGFFTHGTFAADEGALSSLPAAIGCCRHCGGSGAEAVDALKTPTVSGAD